MSRQFLADALGHSFRDSGLLETALTHRSFGAQHNERLEFLGDSILNCTVASVLFQRYPNLPEGDLSRLRANLVRQDTLYRLAETLHLGDLLKLGEGELRSGGNRRPSILADALEAVFGAVYLDAGFAAAEAVILRLYGNAFDGLTLERAKDPKTRLQEWLQGRKKALPRYAVLETSGAAHEQRFVVSCEIEQPQLRTNGSGSSRRAAEQAAAEAALKVLEA